MEFYNSKFLTGIFSLPDANLHSDIVIATTVILLFPVPLFRHTPLSVLFSIIIAAMLGLIYYNAAIHLDKFDLVSPVLGTYFSITISKRKETCKSKNFIHFTLLMFVIKVVIFLLWVLYSVWDQEHYCLATFQASQHTEVQYHAAYNVPGFLVQIPRTDVQYLAI